MLVPLFAACGKKKDTPSVYYLNFKPEQAEQWNQLAKAYTAETGVKVTVNTLLPKAKVGITATEDGPISAENENMQAYLDAGYLVSADSTKILTVKENILHQESK